MTHTPQFEDTPENRFRLGVYLSLRQQGINPQEAADRARAAWVRKQEIYNSWHAKLIGWAANIMVIGGIMLLI